MLYQFAYTALETHSNPFRWLEADGNLVGVPEDVLESDSLIPGFFHMSNGPAFVD